MFEIQNFSYIRFIHPFEWVMLGVYSLVILAAAFLYQSGKIRKDKRYRFFFLGVTSKVAGAVIFCTIYIYYYNGGDTVSYYETSRALVNLAMKDIGRFAEVITSPPSLSGYFMFDETTGYPWPYMYNDPATFYVAKFVVPFLFLGFKSYLVSSVLLSVFSFLGVWRLYLMLTRYFPHLERRIAIGILFIPSVLFWGSGMMKDTLTFTAVCWFIVGLEGFFISKMQRTRMAFYALFALYVLVAVKPYVLYSLLPGSVIWVLFNMVKKVPSKLVRYAFVPAVMVISIVLGFGALSLLGKSMGKFSIDRLLETASVTQKDLKQDYYQGSSFDIGEFEPTIPGLISKVPAAMAVGLFRPFIWEARNVVMLASGLENLIFLWLTISFVWNALLNRTKLVQLMSDYPILLFFLSYTLFFSVMVGLSTSNFGALVRFKVPFLSTYVTLMLILNYYFSNVRLVGEKEQVAISGKNL